MAVSGRPASGGLFNSLRALLATVLGIGQLRLEILSTELEAEKLRLFDALWRVALGGLFLGVATVLLVAFVLLLFWDHYRLPALGVMTVLFLGGGAACLVWARRGLQAGEGGPFALSLGELQRDLDGLKSASASASVSASASASTPVPPAVPPAVSPPRAASRP